MIGEVIYKLYDMCIHILTMRSFMKVPTQMRVLATGRIKDRNQHFAKANTYYLHKALDKWIDDHTKGNSQLVLNFLVAKGIEAMMKDGDVAMVDDMGDVIKEMGL